MKSVMQNMYEFSPSLKRRRSKFNLSHGHTLCFDAGLLIPFFWDEVIPGDTLNLKAYANLRLTTAITPVMDNIKVKTEYFFVPMRIIWDNYNKFFGERYPDPDSSIDYETPKINFNTTGTHQHIGDYLGIPPGVTPDMPVTSLVHRAYYKIINDWYRRAQLISAFNYGTGDGPDNNDAIDITPMPRAKGFDYFTSCLTDPQYGDEVMLPLGDECPVIGNPDGTGITFYDGTQAFGIAWDSAQNLIRPDVTLNGDDTGDAAGYTNPSQDDRMFGLTNNPDKTGMVAALSEAVGASINQFREANMLQAFRELEARSGTRYRELINAFFGVDTGDMRPLRPEYLGGSSQYMNVRACAQTSETNTTPQGTLTGIGQFNGEVGGFYKSFYEHGYVMGIISVVVDIRYQQGIDRKLLRDVREDFYWPQFAHLGEQAVYNQEIYTDGTSADSETFGYQERYHESRQGRSRISGDVRSSFAETLHYWHLAEEFTSRPSLGAAFIQDKSKTVLERVLALTDNGNYDYPQIFCDSFFDYNGERIMPTRGVPGLGHHL